MKKLSAFFILFLFALPAALAHADSASSTEAARAQLIEAYLEDAGCKAPYGCSMIARSIESSDASFSTSSAPQSNPTPASPTAAVPLVLHAIIPPDPPAPAPTPLNLVPPLTNGVPSVALASVPQGAGGTLLERLPTLFVLDALFAGKSGGLISPGPATLGNIIILYQIFFAPHLFQ